MLSDIKVFRAWVCPWRKFTAQERSLFFFFVGQGSKLVCKLPTLAGVAFIWARECRELPHSDAAVALSLLQHFVESTGLNLELEDLSSMDVRKNQSFILS